MAKLYELVGDYRKFNDYVDAAWDSEDLTEDDLEMFISTLDSIQDAIDVKVENTVKFLKNIEGDIKAFKEEEDRIAKRRKYLQNKFEGLKEYLRGTLDINGIDKVKAGTFNVALQKNPPSVFIHNENIIPVEYRQPQPDKILNTEILKALKNGEEVIGASIAPEKKHLRIR